MKVVQIGAENALEKFLKLNDDYAVFENLPLEGPASVAGEA